MEKRKFKKSEIAISIAAVFVIFLFAFSYIMYNRSVVATLAEYYLSLTTKEVTKEEKIKELEDRLSLGDVKNEFPDYKFDFSFEEKDEAGMQVYYLNEQEKPRDVIFYLHGGSYIDQPVNWHYRFINKLANNTNAVVIMPLYPLAPNHTYLKAYEVVTKLYLDVLYKYQESNIILMGDSAGGGFALGLAQYLNTLNIAQPDRLILISPWVDISMTNPEISEFEGNDPMLQKEVLDVCASSWAGNEDLKHWMLSPIYGDLSVLDNVSIFVGTREILYPDCKLLAEKLSELDVECEFNVGIGLNHDFVLFPISEANKAMTIIKKNIANISDKENNK